MIVLNEATSPLILPHRTAGREYSQGGHGQGVIWIVNRVAMAAKFERVIVLDDGRLAEQGTFEELDKDGTALRGLLETA